MRPSALVFNPLAGRGRLAAQVPRVLENLRWSGYDAEAVPTRGAGDAEHRARDSAARGAEVIFALGGDGTLRECAAGILSTGATLGFLPSGTMNVMALELGIRGRCAAAARTYRDTREIRLGVGLAAGSAFLMQVSAGVDAFLIASLRPREKKLLGRAATVPAILRSLVRYPFSALEVETETGVHRATLAVASNIARYGGPFKLTPNARADGGRLELFLYSGRGRAAAIRFALSLLVGRHLGLQASSVESVRSASFRAGTGIPFQIDGDVLACPPNQALAVSIATESLPILVPVSRSDGEARRRP